MNAGPFGRQWGMLAEPAGLFVISDERPGPRPQPGCWCMARSGGDVARERESGPRDPRRQSAGQREPGYMRTRPLRVHHASCFYVFRRIPRVSSFFFSPRCPPSPSLLSLLSLSLPPISCASSFFSCLLSAHSYFIFGRKHISISEWPCFSRLFLRIVRASPLVILISRLIRGDLRVAGLWTGDRPQGDLIGSAFNNQIFGGDWNADRASIRLLSFQLVHTRNWANGRPAIYWHLLICIFQRNAKEGLF